MSLIDSHCHLDRLDLSPYEGSLGLALAAAQNLGVAHFLCVGIDLNNSLKVREIAETYPFVSASIGLHPTEEVSKEPAVEDLIRLAHHPKVVAIGETGLDYYRLTSGPEIQQQRFRNHIRAARSVNKPLIIHTREARDDTIRLLKEEGAEAVGGVLHCFTETLAMAEAAIELGFYISFSGIITFKNAVELQNVVRALPLAHMLIETDSPYLAPVPYRGKSNQPAYVLEVAKQVATLKGITLEEVIRVTGENYRRLFGREGIQ